MTKHEYVEYRGRSYLVLYFPTGPQVSVEFQRWSGLGAVQVSRTVKRGPTRDAVLKLADRRWEKTA